MVVADDVLAVRVRSDGEPASVLGRIPVQIFAERVRVGPLILDDGDVNHAGPPAVAAMPIRCRASRNPL